MTSKSISPGSVHRLRDVAQRLDSIAARPGVSETCGASIKLSGRMSQEMSVCGSQGGKGLADITDSCARMLISTRRRHPSIQQCMRWNCDDNPRCSIDAISFQGMQSSKQTLRTFTCSSSLVCLLSLFSGVRTPFCTRTATESRNLEARTPKCRYLTKSM